MAVLDSNQQLRLEALRAVVELYGKGDASGAGTVTPHKAQVEALIEAAEKFSAFLIGDDD